MYAYTYLSSNNRLQSVMMNGAANRTVTYDNNGNMMTDSKLGITATTITRANLPGTVTKGATNITYHYSTDDYRIYKNTGTLREWYLRTANGVDLGVFDITNNKVTWYAFGAERVAKINHAPTVNFTEAAANTGGNTYTTDPYLIALTVATGQPAPMPDFYAYDHLGNTRLVYGVSFVCTNTTPTYAIKYAADYYTFGKVLREWTATTSEKYLYTQHERDKETGLDYAGARFYDSELGRFTGTDPNGERYASWTPYNYVFNNPTILIDPDGKDAIVSKIFNEEGKVIGVRVSATVYIYGEKSSPDLARSLEEQVNKAWNNETSSIQWSGSGKDYNVQFDIKFISVPIEEASKRALGNENHGENFLRVYEGTTEVFGSKFEGNSGKLDLIQNSATNNTTAPHEIGHMMGFRNPDKKVNDETHFSQSNSDGSYPMMYSGAGGNEVYGKRKVGTNDINGLNLLNGLFGTPIKGKIIGENNNNKILKTKDEINEY